jgi:hypothetical protein
MEKFQAFYWLLKFTSPWAFVVAKQQLVCEAIQSGCLIVYIAYASESNVL